MRSGHLVCEDSYMTPCSTGFGLLAGAWWDSETENKSSKPRETYLFIYLFEYCAEPHMGV